MASRRVSKAGKNLIRQRRAALGWLYTDPRWAIAFGKIIQPELDWEEIGESDPYRAISESSMRRFQGGEPIVSQNFNIFCQSLNLDPNIIAESLDAVHTPNNDFFCGRQAEIQQLNQWLIQDNVPFLNIWGETGIGKSALVSHWIKNQNAFSDIVWQSMELEDSEISCRDFVEDVLLMFSRKVENNQSHFLEFNRLLSERKIMIILDGSFSDKYLKWFETNLKKQRYSSAVIIISESRLELGISNANAPKNYQVNGLDLTAIEEIWRHQTRNMLTEISCKNSLKELSGRYNGNPGFINLIIGSIKDVFAGDLRAAMEETIYIPTWAKKTFFDKRFNSLSIEEQQILIAIAGVEEELSLREIKSLTQQDNLLSCLDTLLRSSILQIKTDQDGSYYSIPALWRKYLQRHFPKK